MHADALAPVAHVRVDAGAGRRLDREQRRTVILRAWGGSAGLVRPGENLDSVHLHRPADGQVRPLVTVLAGARAGAVAAGCVLAIRGLLLRRLGVRLRARGVLAVAFSLGM